MDWIHSSSNLITSALGMACKPMQTIVSTLQTTGRFHAVDQTMAGALSQLAPWISPTLCGCCQVLPVDQLNAPLIYRIQELRNKVGIYNTVRQIESILKGIERSDSISAYLERTHSIEPFLRGWSFEGVGYEFGKSILRSECKPLQRDQIPEQAMLMVHTGLGMAISETVLSRHLRHKSPDWIVENFLSLVDSIAISEYQQVCWEPFGLMLRLYNREIEKAVVELIRKKHPRFCLSCFHGIGRACYFAWEFFPPVCAAQIDILVRDAESESEANNVLAGFAWALTLVNLKNPKLVHFLLDDLSVGAAQRKAISNGIASSLVVGYHSAPNVDYMDRLQTAAMQSDSMTWNLIAKACETSRKEFESRRRQIGDFFTYQDDLT